MNSTTPTAILTLTSDVPAQRTRELRHGVRFHGDRSKQLDAISGSPDAMVAADHPVRAIIEFVEKLNLIGLRARHRPLGRTPMDPKFKLRVWLYASTVGLHEASVVARALKTDAALRLAAGGHSMGPSILKDFRAENGPLFMDLNEQILRIAVERKVISPREIAVDSMRLEADASKSSMRTKTRSTKRLEELAKVDVAGLSSDEMTTHEAKVIKHRTALERLDAEGRTSLSVTTPEAALMKFPSGASLPGHRITAAVSGVTERFIVHVFVDSAATDFGKLSASVLGARDALVRAGVPVVPGAMPMQVAADAGYMSEADLRFVVSERERGRIDTLLPAPTEPQAKGHFLRSEFWFDENGEVVCPAGRVMSGPSTGADGRLTWTGRGCADCLLRPQCTAGARRTLSITPATDALRAKVKERIEEPGARERYGQRIATVEPVFSYLEDVMKFTRASSRRTATIHAEVYMKVLAYNITRLAAAARGGASLSTFVIVLGKNAHGYEICEVWIPAGDTALDGYNAVKPL